MTEGQRAHTIDDASGNYPLEVTTLHEGDESTSASIDVKCGCGDDDHHLVIGYDHKPTGNPDMDTLEIGNVMATLSQWRTVLSPLLGPPEDVPVD